MKSEQVKQEFEKLLNIMEKLRGPKGCSWDKKQDYYSLQPYILEEAYEVVEVLQNKDLESLPTELGDLLLQVIFQAQIGKEKGDFDIQDVLSSINAKLVRRHPHVFSDIKVENVAEIKYNWEKIKESEKDYNETKTNSIMEGLNQSNPSLLQSYEVQKRAAEKGFDWDNITGVLAKIEEEVEEVRQAIEEQKKDKIKGEIGDLLFSVVNLARFMDINPELAALKTLNKFKERFKYMEKEFTENDMDFTDKSLPQLESYWQKAKKEEKKGRCK